LGRLKEAPASACLILLFKREGGGKYEDN